MATSYLQKQISSAGSTTTATISVWVKRNKVSSGEHSLVGGIYSGTDRSSVYFDSNDKITVQHYEVGTGRGSSKCDPSRLRPQKHGEDW